MRRRRGVEAGNTGQRSQEGAWLANATSGNPMPEHELNVLGVANVNRAFSITDVTNGPAVVFRECWPYNAFFLGYSSVSTDPSNQDTDAAIDTTAVSTAELYPVTYMATDFGTYIWPILRQMFNSGVGSRANVSVSEFVRYQAMVIYAYTKMMDVVTANHLAYHFDWSKVSPFTTATPKYIYDWAEYVGASDPELAGVWLPIMKRFDYKICFPRILNEIKRMMRPMLSIDLNGRMNLPVVHRPFTYSKEQYQTDITSRLDYMDVQLATPGSVIASFLPFSIGAMTPWSIPNEPDIDVARDAGMFNSGVKNIPSFGDTGDPNTTTTNTIFDQDTVYPNQGVFFTRHSQPVWSEVKLATVYLLVYGVVDNTFVQLTPHWYAEADIIADDGSVIVYDGVQVPLGTDANRYLQYINSRFTQGNTEYGQPAPGFQGAIIPLETFYKQMRLETDYIWNSDVLRLVATRLAGSSLREMRYFIQQAVMDKMRQEETF